MPFGKVQNNFVGEGQSNNCTFYSLHKNWGVGRRSGMCTLYILITIDKDSMKISRNFLTVSPQQAVCQWSYNWLRDLHIHFVTDFLFIRPEINRDRSLRDSFMNFFIEFQSENILIILSISILLQSGKNVWQAEKLEMKQCLTSDMSRLLSRDKEIYGLCHLH